MVANEPPPQLEADNSSARQTWMCQCMILKSLGMIYSGNKRLLEIAEAMRNSAATTVRRIGCLSHPFRPPQPQSPDQKTSLDTEWREWVAEESFRRLGFCAFVRSAPDCEPPWMRQDTDRRVVPLQYADAQVTMHLDLMPVMSPAELRRPLPELDGFWDAPDAKTWHELRQNAGRG